MALSDLLCRAKSLEIQHRALPRYPDAQAAAAEQTRLTSRAAGSRGFPPRVIFPLAVQLQRITMFQSGTNCQRDWKFISTAELAPRAWAESGFRVSLFAFPGMARGAACRRLRWRGKRFVSGCRRGRSRSSPSCICTREQRNAILKSNDDDDADN